MAGMPTVRSHRISTEIKYVVWEKLGFETLAEQAQIDVLDKLEDLLGDVSWEGGEEFVVAGVELELGNIVVVFPAGTVEVFDSLDDLSTLRLL